MSEIDTTQKCLLDDERAVLNPNSEEIDSITDAANISKMQQSLLDLHKKKRMIELERRALHLTAERKIDREIQETDKKLRRTWNLARLRHFTPNTTAIATTRTNVVAQGGSQCPSHKEFLGGKGVKAKVMRTMCGPKNKGVWVTFPEESGMKCDPNEWFFYRLSDIETRGALKPSPELKPDWQPTECATSSNIKWLVRRFVSLPAALLGPVKQDSKYDPS